MHTATPQAISLFKALTNRGITCNLEDDGDGHKCVDISIRWAKINIEVDGLHHYTDPEQIKRDFRRNYYSVVNDDFDTFHVSNSIIDSSLDQVADALASVARSHYRSFKEEERQRKQRSIFTIIRIFFTKTKKY